MTSQTVEEPQVEAPSPPTWDAYLLITKIKPGKKDALLAAVADQGHKLMDPTGALNSVGTVHFARVALLDDETFLFASVFDGDWESYLDDFFSFTNAGAGFDAVFRYCEGWPGPNDHDGFINFWTTNRVRELALYSNYPGVTAKQIHKAVRIQRNLEAVLEDFQ